MPSLRKTVTFKYDLAVKEKKRLQKLVINNRMQKDLAYSPNISAKHSILIFDILNLRL